MEQCHFCGLCQDPRCLSKEAHVADCTGLDVGAIRGGVAWCLMCMEEDQAVLHVEAGSGLDDELMTASIGTSNCVFPHRGRLPSPVPI